MAVLKRGEVAEPVLPKETVEVPSLGGELVVRGLLLSEKLAVESRIVATAQDKGAADGVHAILPVLLALCVVDADGLPFWTEGQWQIFGASQAKEAIALFNVAWRLSGFAQAETAKN